MSRTKKPDQATIEKIINLKDWKDKHETNADRVKAAIYKIAGRGGWEIEETYIAAIQLLARAAYNGAERIEELEAQAGRERDQGYREAVIDIAHTMIKQSDDLMWEMEKRNPALKARAAAKSGVASSAKLAKPSAKPRKSQGCSVK